MSDQSDSQNSDRQARLERVLADYLHSVETGVPLDRPELLAAHPDLADELRSFFHNHDSIGRLAVPLKAAVDAPTILGMSGAGASPLGSTVRYFGDYELLDEIARGGMGVVFKARQVNLNRVVALKMILAGQLAHDSDVKRFYAEAEAAAKLDHPGIVPIFEIGQHDGQHYFSMAFVEGQSLAKKVIDGPLPPREAAEMVKKVAEAVEYAHEKGIIHRDLKPANVLLDHHGLPKVTDFGLAKQTQGDSGLTGTGQILGTPSYMPPEQAAGKMDEVGPQADVYSLGAIMYCLLTGRPPFQAANPIETLKAVIDHEPVAVRQLNPHVPLDLETIAFKCLAKNPRDRYATAQALADDLTAFADNRPISARRATVAERTVRWFRRQKKSVIVAASAAAAALVIGVVALIALALYARSQLGYLRLTVTTLAGDRPEAADVLDTLGALQQSISLPMRDAVPLPNGAYQVRLTAAGRLSETYLVDVTAGERVSHEVALADVPLWKLALNSPQTCSFVNLGDEMRVLVGPQDATLPILACYAGRDAGGGAPALQWKADWSPESPRLAALLNTPDERAAWQQFVAAWAQAGSEPRLVQPALDLDGDGIGDLAWWYAQGIVAVSGRDGAALWFFRPAGSGGAAGQVAAPPVVFSATNAKGAVASRQGLIALCAQGNETWLEALVTAPGQGVPSQVVPGQVVPGGDDRAAGPAQPARIETRWRQSLAADLSATAPPFAECALSLCQRAGRPCAVCIAGRQLAGFDAITGDPSWPAHDLRARPIAPAAFFDLDADGQQELLVVHREESFNFPLQAIGLTPDAPRELWRTTVQHVEFQLLITRQVNVRRMLPWPLQPGVVQSLRDAAEAAPWPMLVDLDGDRKPEIIVPAKGHGGRSPASKFNGVVVLEGATGKVRFERRWPRHSSDEGVDYFHPVHDAYASGPDLDGDGHQELFVASIYDEQHRENITQSGMVYRMRSDEFLYIDCLSGRDGQSLWWSREPLGSAGNAGGVIGPLIWWGADTDGLPQLVVPVIRHQDVPVERAFIFSAAGGRVLRVMHDIARPVAADFDADGVADLATFQPDDPQTFERSYGQAEAGKLRVVRGTPPESFRRLGPWSSLADLDGDGQPELVRQPDAIHNRTLAVASGRDGTIVRHWPVNWSDRRSDHGEVVQAFSLPGGDFDGHGIADLVVSIPDNHLNFWPQTPTPGFRCGLALQALAGETGLPIWREPVVLLPDTGPNGEWQFRYQPRARVLRVSDVDRDGQPELVCDLSWDADRFSPESRHFIRSQRELALIRARDGTLLWSAPYGEFTMESPVSYFPWFELSLPTEFADLDGDGVDDIVFIAPQLSADHAWSAAPEARSGRDGRVLWQLPPLVVGPRSDPSTNVAALQPMATIGSFRPPRMTDLDRDGRSEVILNEMSHGYAEQKISLLNGETGERLWTKPALEAVVISLDTADSPQAGKPPVARRGVVVTLSGNSGVVLVDKAGHELERAPHCGTWAFDLDGDGKDELVEQVANRLRAHRGGLNKPFWQWIAPGGAPVLALELLPSSHQALVATAGDSLFVLDAATGRSQLRTRREDLSASIAQSGFVFGNDTNFANRPTHRGASLPLTISRRMVATNADGTAAAPSPKGYADAKSFRLNQVSQTDPRLARQVPWVPSGLDLAMSSERRGDFIIGACCAVALPILVILLPLRILRRTLERRQTWRWRALRILVGVGLSVGMLALFTTVASLVFPIGANFTWEPVLGLAIVFLLPLIVWPGSVVRLIRVRKWKSLAALLLATVAACVPLGYWMIHEDRHRLAAGGLYQLHHVWDAWWLILIEGAWGVGWLLIAIRAFGPPLGWLRRRVRGGII